jgi:hypothetical protein
LEALEEAGLLEPGAEGVPVASEAFGMRMYLAAQLPEAQAKQSLKLGAQITPS